MIIKISLVITMISLLGFIALNDIQPNDKFAQKNGWGKATSEQTKEDDAASSVQTFNPNNDNIKGTISNIGHGIYFNGKGIVL